MACGNNHVSRDYLSSAPKSAPSVVNALFTPPPIVRLPRAPTSKKWGGKDKQMFYSRGTETKTDYFVGPDGNPTYAPDRHVHVIHDEKSKTVTLLLTDRTHQKDQHPETVTLRNDPSGNEVNAAIAAMLQVMNDRPKGTNVVTWP